MTFSGKSAKITVDIHIVKGMYKNENKRLGVFNIIDIGNTVFVDFNNKDYRFFCFTLYREPLYSFGDETFGYYG